MLVEAEADFSTTCLTSTEHKLVELRKHKTTFRTCRFFVSSLLGPSSRHDTGR